MTKSDAVADMDARLRAINWERDGAHALSRRALLKEYLRRAAQWAEALGCTDKWPFFDVAACINSNVRVDSALIADLDEYLDSARAGWHAGRIAPWILQWAALRSAPGVGLPDLDDPFEPLLLMFERGGGFHSEHGELNLETVSIRLRPWHEHLSDTPMVAFDEATLDKMDAEDPLRRAG